MSSEVSMPGAEHDREPTVEELKRALAEAREEQAATAEILRVISSSPMDLKRVLAELAASAAHHCGAYDVSIFQVDGDFLRLVGHYGPIPALSAGDDSLPLTRSVATGRAVLDRRTIHVADMQVAADEYPESRARSLDFRTILAVPLIRAGKATGAIGIRRTEARLFNDNQIKLLETFANQAVIAIENTRLFEAEQASKRELQESLEYQTAISEVLAVISRSPNDLQPVLRAIVETAARLVQADKANILRKHGDRYRTVASIGFMHAQRDFVEQTAVELDPATLAGRVALDRKTVHIPDVLEDRNLRMDIVSGIDFRTGLGVPLLREGELIGLLLLAREKQQPYSRRQIALVETFADQAVIAIENARLLEAEQASKRELTEALEQQTSTADVLKVISRSAFDLQAVLDTLVESAARLCHADKANIARISAGAFQFISFFGFKPEYREYLLSLQTSMADRGSITGRTVVEGRTVHVVDLMADPEFTWFEAQKRGGFRTALGVPLMREGTPIGVFFLAREEVEPFTQQEIDLVTTFADQAVIAIENTRLFEQVQVRTAELQESLEYQTATGEVLNVISSSKFDLQPVLDTIVETAARLCQAEFAFVLKLDADQFDLVAASKNVPAETTRWIADHAPTVSLDRGSLAGRVALDRTAIHMPDVLTDREYKEWGTQKLGGIRSQLGVPLLRDGLPVGVICLARTVVKPFTDKQIELVTTFADQAVIAIENTRLFEEVQARTGELQESLEYQTATSEVLSVISRSPNDLQPVLDTISATAGKLCEADDAHVLMLQEDKFHLVAHNQSDPKVVAWFRAYPFGMEDPGSVSARAARQRRSVHVHDVRADPDFGVGGPITFSNGRSVLSVPLLRAGMVVGVVTVSRRTVRPFTDRQIALVQTFADQAVIAVENTRLFEEVQARNRELRTALEQQTATSELLKVIGRSTFELQPVFDTLAENAVRLCAAERAFVHRFDGQFLRVAATYNVSPELRAFIEHNPMAPGRYGVAARAALERRTVHIRDVQAEPEITFAAREIEPVRTALSVPMLRSEELLGVIMIYRHEVSPFADSQVALIETFADQAAIAVENSRLLEELQARNSDLTALGEVGRAVSSTLDLKVVLKTIVDRAVELSGNDGGSIFYFREDIGRFQLGETTGLDEEVVARVRELDIAAGQTGLGEAIAKREPLQMPDILERPSNPLRDAVIAAGFRATLIVPLLSGDGPLGALVLQRRRPGKFPPAVVSLMQSFADQSAIALENARLFEEIAQKSRELEIASQHKSQFVANMSHELRTPLAAILGYAELIQEGFYEPQGPKSIDALSRIRSNGKHLLGLINTVLDIAKIESGQFTLNMAEYAIESVVETVRSATESLAQNKKLSLKTDVAKSLPIGVGDEQRLTQVLLNLVGNAIKFTDTGEVCVIAKAVNGHFNVSVTDTGPGIPTEHQTRIFAQFHQVDSSNTKAKGGTGLGLAIAKQIVEMHGGRIWVESALGKGSTFQMEIPTSAASR